ncbi:MAG: hypothetical protein PF444_08915 [Bacteroidales bacterium]|jgi:hypothetical protein|nr:hypothetical protein [Bacteroidales bacterium]
MLLLLIKNTIREEHGGLYDTYTFADVNNGQQVIAGGTIALQKGIRDLHLFEDPTACFIGQ